jgi:hypothetical protein
MPNGQPAAPGTQAAANHSGDPQHEDKQVAGGPKDNQHPGADISKGKPGGTSAATAGQPKQGAPRPDLSKQGSGKPANSQFAAAKGIGKPADPAKHADNAKPPVKGKPVEPAAKNKGDHPKKPGGKDEKQQHDKPG